MHCSELKFAPFKKPWCHSFPPVSFTVAYAGFKSVYQPYTAALPVQHHSSKAILILYSSYFYQKYPTSKKYLAVQKERYAKVDIELSGDQVKEGKGSKISLVSEIDKRKISVKKSQKATSKRLCTKTGKIFLHGKINRISISLAVTCRRYLCRNDIS